MSAKDALAAHLGLPLDDISECEWDPCSFEAGSETWLVLTEEEADERAREYIRESVWAFNASFLAAYMPVGIGVAEIEQIRGDRCEDANPAILALIKAGGSSFEDFADDAIAADGRGQFLATYDGEEHQHGPYFLYRTC